MSFRFSLVRVLGTKDSLGGGGMSRVILIGSGPEVEESLDMAEATNRAAEEDPGAERHSAALGGQRRGLGALEGKEEEKL